MIAVIDIDGVVADVRHRVHHVAVEPKHWGAFFSAAPDDPVLEQGVVTVRKLAEVYEIFYLSGRPEHCRQDTLDWFERHDLPPGELHLRPNNDYRPSRIFKVEMLDRFSQRATVVVFVDDDPMVWESARQAGYDVLPATWMGHLPALHEAQEVDGQT